LETLKTLTYERTGPIARITLNRPERGNGITLEMPREIAACVERANLDPEVHVIALSGNGKGFCGGYDLVASAERMDVGLAGAEAPPGSPLDPAVQLQNHDPQGVWDPMVDFAMMSRNVRGFMSLFWSEKPVVCKVHGFCVAGGTDMALCSDLLVIEDTAKIGYPPARVWGVPTSALWMARLGPERAKRLLFTGDCLSGKEAVEWGLGVEAPPADKLNERFESLLERIARMPVNQLVMMKLLVNQQMMAQGLHATQLLGTVFDGVARHTPEGYAFQMRAAEVGFKKAVASATSPSATRARRPSRADAYCWTVPSLQSATLPANQSLTLFQPSPSCQRTSARGIFPATLSLHFTEKRVAGSLSGASAGSLQRPAAKNWMPFVVEYGLSIFLSSFASPLDQRLACDSKPQWRPLISVPDAHARSCLSVDTSVMSMS
jgi:enoyl-CoA hydratase